MTENPNPRHAHHRTIALPVGGADRPYLRGVSADLPALPPLRGQMRLIAFITFSADIHKILDHIGFETQAPRISPARGPPLWEGEGAQDAGEGVEGEPHRDMTS